MPAYQPTNGDHVTVTRAFPNGRRATWTGRISDYIPHDESAVLAESFRLTGTGPNGQPDDSHFAGAPALLKHYDIVQTIAPAVTHTD